MTTGRVKSGVGVAATVLGLATVVMPGCTTESDSTAFPMGGSSGNGGSSGASGGGNAGVSGAGGTASAMGGSGSPDLPDAALPRFQAVLQGDQVTLTPLDPVWIRTCFEPNPRLAQRSGDSWTLLQDDRPEGINLNHAAHYLDGVYQSDCRQSLGCDVAGCRSYAEAVEDEGAFQFRLVAREYVQVGQQAALSCLEDGGVALHPGDAGDAGLSSVPAIESRAPTGDLAVRLEYFRDSSCQTEAITTDIPVEP